MFGGACSGSLLPISRTDVPCFLIVMTVSPLALTISDQHIDVFIQIQIYEQNAH